MDKKDKKRAGWHSSTQLSHAPRVKMMEGNLPILPPIYQSAKFTLAPDEALANQFIYTRISNPTLKELELTLSEIQEKEDTIVFASGIAAISGSLLGLLKKDDHLIIFREIYRPARIFIRDMLPRFGINSTVLKLSELDLLESHIQPGKTRMIYFESPSNPHLQIADIEKITTLAQKHQLISVLDGTFGGIHQHTQFKLDLVVHSLTKFANGHGDVVAGSVSGKKELIHQIRQMSTMLGATLDPHAAFMVSRGLKTYLLRYQRQCKTATRIAEFLSTHPKVVKVYYPGLKDHPSHQLAKKQMLEMGGILAFELATSCGEAHNFCHKLQLIQYAVSVGSTETLICPTQMFFADDLGEEDRSQMGINQYSLRLSVGLEHEDDILADLSAALG